MGRPKQLLPYRNTTLLGTAVSAAEESLLDSVIVVVGAAALEVEASLQVTRAEVVRNLRYHDGNLSSFLTGIAAAGEFDAAMLLLGDMPGVDAVLIDEVLASWRQDPAPIQVTAYRNGSGHPFVFDRQVIAELDGLEGTKPLWRLIPGRDDVRTIAVDRDRPIDVDTPEDYERLLAEG